ncbi:hypothetical protein ACQ4PT_011569 [Festuca glaucescens]
MHCCGRCFTRFNGGWPSSAHGTSPCGGGFGSWTPSSRPLVRCYRRWVSCGLLHNDEHLLKQEVPSLRNCAARLPCHGHSRAASISLHPREWPLVQSSSSLPVHLHKVLRYSRYDVTICVSKLQGFDKIPKGYLLPQVLLSICQPSSAPSICQPSSMLAEHLHANLRAENLLAVLRAEHLHGDLRAEHLPAVLLKLDLIRD